MINNSIPSPYGETVKLAQEILNFWETNKGSALFYYLDHRDEMTDWLATIRTRAAVVRGWGFNDADKARRMPDEARQAFLSNLLTPILDEEDSMVLESRPEILISSGEYEVYKRGACQALNLDPHSERPLREIYAEERKKK